jgi:hypothetical protein
MTDNIVSLNKYSVTEMSNKSNLLTCLYGMKGGGTTEICLSVFRQYFLHNTCNHSARWETLVYNIKCVKQTKLHKILDILEKHHGTACKLEDNIKIDLKEIGCEYVH